MSFEPNPLKWIVPPGTNWKDTLITFHWQSESNLQQHHEMRASNALKGDRDIPCPLSKTLEDGKLLQNLIAVASTAANLHSAEYGLSIICSYLGQQTATDIFEPDPAQWITPEGTWKSRTLVFFSWKLDFMDNIIYSSIMAHNAVSQNLPLPPELGIKQLLIERYLKLNGRFAWKWLPESKPLQDALAKVDDIPIDSPMSVESNPVNEHRNGLMFSSWKQLIIANALVASGYSIQHLHDDVTHGDCQPSQCQGIVLRSLPDGDWDFRDLQWLWRHHVNPWIHSHKESIDVLLTMVHDVQRVKNCALCCGLEYTGALQAHLGTETTTYRTVSTALPTHPQDYAPALRLLFFKLKLKNGSDELIHGSLLDLMATMALVANSATPASFAIDNLVLLQYIEKWWSAQKIIRNNNCLYLQ